ncbi:MAG: hypothetical protein FJ137_08070 [Deltaproteobacteria bacterium]|nr:hypothetical protein [Deltaproteobacteria bacterium]
MTTKNRWQSFDGTDPVLAWTLSTPAPTAAERRALVDEVLAAGRTSGVLFDTGGAVVSGDGEPLPWGPAVASGAAAPFAARVFVRDGHGAIVERSAPDAGALLRGLEPLEPAYARRFAAPRPFSAAWSTSTPTSIAVHVGFFTSLWFDDTDAALLARNEPPLLAFRAALVGTARRRGGRLVAPTAPTGDGAAQRT